MNVIDWVKSMVTSERWKHIESVRKMAVSLASKWDVDQKQADLAGLIHDVARDFSNDDLLKMANEFDIVIDEFSRQSPILLHGPVGAILAQKKFSLTRDVFNSVYYHTTGWKNMSFLEKIVYIADKIEDNRTFPGVEVLREEAFLDLDRALILVLENSLRYQLSKHAPIHPLTIEAWNSVVTHMQ
ncbi:MAG: HD domain-containing protein [Firmicutes bacterium]|nr:HD domain-containing protein [Bacillota bacterium]